MSPNVQYSRRRSRLARPRLAGTASGILQRLTLPH